jgi:hypothetical protein
MGVSRSVFVPRRQSGPIRRERATTPNKGARFIPTSFSPRVKSHFNLTVLAVEDATMPTLDTSSLRIRLAIE